MENVSRLGDLEVETRGQVGIITINRPAKLNALTAAIWSDLMTALDRFGAADDIRAIILTGAGDRAFSAGGDIPGFV